MIYSILKDENPCKTRKKIESIIKKIKLPVKLNCSNYSFLYRNKIFSHRLSLFNINEFGVNGKGRTKENSIASSYGELMERLQNQYLFPIISDKYIFAPDEKIININELVLSEIAKYFDDNDLLIKLANISNRVQMNYYKYSERYSALTNVRINNNETILLPFYSLKQEKNVNLPVYIINKLQGSTGMCAGNTMEEALVEGLSEICERYVLRKVFSSDIKLPNIPKNIYEKYKDIKKMVDYYEKNGYKLYIKDASLGCKLPVVCIIFHNIKNDFYHISF